MRTLLAATYYDTIFTSTDAGATWNRQLRAGWRTVFSSIAITTDGTRMIAAGSDDNDGAIYVSTDSGATWTKRSSFGSSDNWGNWEWKSVAMSSDGSKLVAVGGYGTNASMYTSSDFGATWTEQAAAGVHHFTAVASSADGSKLVAAAGDYYNPGYLYTSSDSGVTWTEQTAAGNRYWSSVALSADGSTVLAGSQYSVDAGYGRIHLSSDSGATWTTSEAGDMQNVAMSADATRLFVTSQYSTYVSNNSGASWAIVNHPNGIYNPTALAARTDGSHIYATSSSTGAILTGVFGEVADPDPVDPVDPPGSGPKVITNTSVSMEGEQKP